MLHVVNAFHEGLERFERLLRSLKKRFLRLSAGLLAGLSQLIICFLPIFEPAGRQQLQIRLLVHLLLLENSSLPAARLLLVSDSDSKVLLIVSLKVTIHFWSLCSSSAA